MQTYSTKANANRAARSKGYTPDQYDTYQDEHGKWYWMPKQDGEGHTDTPNDTPDNTGETDMADNTETTTDNQPETLPPTVYNLAGMGSTDRLAAVLAELTGDSDNLWEYVGGQVQVRNADTDEVEKVYTAPDGLGDNVWFWLAMLTPDFVKANRPKPKYADKGTRPKAGTTTAKVWDLADANPDLGRKAVVDLAVQAGVNVATARTQYQRWYKAQGK